MVHQQDYRKYRATEIMRCKAYLLAVFGRVGADVLVALDV